MVYYPALTDTKRTKQIAERQCETLRSGVINPDETTFMDATDLAILEVELSRCRRMRFGDETPNQRRRRLYMLGDA